MGAVARSKGLTALVAVLLGVFLAETADAHPRRYRKRSPVTVVVQPFLVARSIVHSIAAPVVHAPRALVRSARVQPVPDEEIYDANEVDETVLLENDEAERPMRVAYYTGQVRRPSPPEEEPEVYFDDDEDEDEEEQPRRAGAVDDSELPGGQRPTVRGNRATLRGGVAHAPANAPAHVQRAIWAANSLRHKPYVWGGGHRSFYDRGYDCSGAVSFALHHAGALQSPLPSSGFLSYGKRGRGRWITVYSRPGHTFAVIAGLRFDTTDFRRGGNTGPRWHASMRDTRGYVARHPAGM